MATSYISEQSAAFSLVPALKTILEREYELVVPLSPWLTREISSISNHQHINDQFHILAMFPRRPKISQKNEHISITINDELHTFKEVGQRYRVPVIIGCPNAINFWELANCSDHIWLDINHDKSHEYLIPIETLKKSQNLEEENIITMVSQSATFDMKGFENFVREVRHTYPFKFFGARYKPVYFLIKNTKTC